VTAIARWKDLVVGYELPPYTTPPLTRTDFVRYQGASGDVNPAHHDDEFARAAGFPSAFAPGMYAAGVLGTYLTDSLGAQNIRHFAVRFSDQAWPGDQLTFTARVAVREERDGEKFVELDARCVRQNGSVHVSGRATFVVPRL
jgi:acyl dehydratase